MEDNHFDIFQLSDKQTSRTDNFFLEAPSIGFDNTNFKDNTRHLNDYDSNILQEGAYRDISDDTLKLEYKISKTEETIKQLEAEINTSKEIQDYAKMQESQTKLIVLKEEYKNLLLSYNERTLSAKISGSISNLYVKTVGTPISYLTSIADKIYRFLISKLPNKFASVIKIKNSLSALESINKSIDSLITLHTPCNENIDKYKKLSKYIIKANEIQTEISQIIKKH